MSKEQIIKCAFCQGTGNNPHFRGTCPVCKGRGKNQIRGEITSCRDCRGSGQKGGTTLTCFTCGGLGVVPDTRETFRRAREEIREAQEEIVRERPARQRSEPQAMAGGPARRSLGEGGEELTEKPMIKIPKDKEDVWEEEKEEEETGGKTHFCQCCGNAVSESVNIRICFDCFNEVKAMRAYKKT